MQHAITSSCVTMAVFKPRGVKSDTWSRGDDQLRADQNYEALAFPSTQYQSESDEESMKPEKATMAPRNSGNKSKYHENEEIEPGTRSRERHEGAHGNGQSILSVREPIEDDEERLSMRQGDVPPPVSEPVANPRIREDRAVQDFRPMRNMCM